MTLRRWLPALVGLLLGLVLVAFMLRGPREQTGVPDATSTVGVATSDPGPRPSSPGLAGVDDPESGASLQVGEPGPAPAARPAGAPAPITGVVVDSTGRGIADAMLTLRPIDPRSLRGAPFPPDDILDGVRSDSEGAFRFEKAPAERWLRIEAEAEGYARSSRLVSSAGAHVTIEMGVGGGLVVEVLPHESWPLLAPPPVATVEAVTETHTEVTETGAKQATATFERLPVGPVRIRVGHRSHGTVLVGPYAIRPGETTRVTVQLPQGVRLGGRVLDAETREPVAGASLKIAHPGRSTDAGTSNAEGLFEDVHAGGVGQRVFVSARAEGYAPALQPVVLMPGGGGTQSVDVLLTPAAPWRGEVVFPRGHPDKHARVYYMGTGIADIQEASTTTDASGRFELPPPPLPAPGRRVVLMAEAGALRGAVALRPHQPMPSPLFVVLSTGGTLTGRLVGKENAPVAGAQVRLFPKWESERSTGSTQLTPAQSVLRAANDRGLESLAAASDAGGRFAIRGVPPATYRIQVTMGDVPRFVGEPVDVGEDGLDLGALEVGTGLVLEGVVRALSGDVLPGARVRLLSQNLRVAADAEGSFRFEDVPAGTHQIEASLPGHTAVRESVEVREGETYVELRLDAAAALELHIQSDEGGVGPFVEVSLIPAGRARPMPPRVVTLGAAKKGTLQDLPSGWFRIFATAKGGWVAEIPDTVELAVGQTSRVTLAFERGAVVFGTLRLADGGAVQGGVIRLGHERTGAVRFVTPSRDGTWRLEGLPTGRYSVEATGRGGVPVRTSLDVQPSETHELPLTLEAGGALRVQAIDADGRAVEGALLLFRGPERAYPASPPDRTDAKGVAVREDLPAGLMRIRARAGGLVGTASARVVAGAIVEVTIRMLTNEAR